MHDRQQPYPIEVLFEDHVTLSDGRSKPHPVLLQLTSETLIIRRLKTSQVSSINHRNFPTITPRHVLLKRHPTTHSFGFSIKGGSDTGKENKTTPPIHTPPSRARFSDSHLTCRLQQCTFITCW